jgi:hypothetical protein
MGLLLPLFSGAGVRDTVHNLSVSGPGNVKSVNAVAVCDFCHISHSPLHSVFEQHGGREPRAANRDVCHVPELP